MRRALGLLLAALVAGVAAASSTGSVRAGEPVSAPGGRVLVIAIPGLRWEDVDRPELPTVRALLDESAVANLATRVTRVVADPGEAYLTIGAGTRAVAPRSLAGLAYEANERVGVGTAGEEYARQQGRAIGAGGVGLLGWQLLEEENSAGDFDPTLGTLGDALAAASVDRGVVGNADINDPLDLSQTTHREAAAALADRFGHVPCGAVGGQLLREDAEAPFGLLLAEPAVVAAVRRCSTPRSVVMVEASDLRRWAVFAGRAAEGPAELARSRALANTDAIVASLLKEMVAEGDAVVVLAPTTDPELGLGVLGIRAPGMPPGLLSSPSTRRSGFAVLADLTPSIASLAGVELDPASLEGRIVEARGDAADPAARRSDLVAAEAAALFRDSQVDPAVFAFTGAVGILALLAALVFARGWARVEPWLGLGALVVVSFPVWTYLAGLVPFHDHPVAAYWAFLLAGSLLSGVILHSLRARPLLPVAVACGALLAVVSVSVVLLGSRLQQSTVFGDSPIVAGRFSGINNVTFAFFAAAAIVLAAAVVQRWRGDRGRIVMLSLLAGALVVDVAPMWGADVGGALAGIPALAVVALGLGRWRMRWRTVALIVLITAAIVVLVGLVDLARPASDRSHLGRLFERIASEGAGGLSTVVQRKAEVNLRSLTGSEWRILFVPLAAATGIVLWQARGRIEALATRLPAARRALPGFALAALLGYAVNDSGIAVPAAMLGFLTPLLVYLVCRFQPADERV